MGLTSLPPTWTMSTNILVFFWRLPLKEDGKFADNARLRTFRNIQENVCNWQISGGKKGKAKNFSSCIEKPLLASPDDDLDTPMLLKSVLPALHLKLSINHILKELAKLWAGGAE